jgi:hypothetical protein
MYVVYLLLLASLLFLKPLLLLASLLLLPTRDIPGMSAVAYAYFVINNPFVAIFPDWCMPVICQVCLLLHASL